MERGLIVKRKTATKRLRAKLSEVEHPLMLRRHEPIPQQGKWLRSVVQGYFNYHGVPATGRLEAFRTETVELAEAHSESQSATSANVGPVRATRRSLDTPAQVLHPYPN